jgi:hypothetical protein
MRSTVTRREGPEITSARSGVPTHSVGRASDRGTPEVARQHRAPPGSRTTTVLPPRRERPRNRPHEIGGCRPRREGPRNRPHQIGGCRPRRGEPRNRPHQIGGAGGGSVTTPPERVPGEHAPGARYFGRPKPRPEKSPRRRTTSRRWQRSLPPSMRSTATVNLPQCAAAGRRLAQRVCSLGT